VLRRGMPGGHAMTEPSLEQDKSRLRRQTLWQAPYPPQPRSRYRACSAEVPQNNGSREWWRRRESNLTRFSETGLFLHLR
jgi:hypothetical protein